MSADTNNFLFLDRQLRPSEIKLLESIFLMGEYDPEDDYNNLFRTEEEMKQIEESIFNIQTFGIDVEELHHLYYEIRPYELFSQTKFVVYTRENKQHYCYLSTSKYGMEDLFTFLIDNRKSLLMGDDFHDVNLISKTDILGTVDFNIFRVNGALDAHTNLTLDDDFYYSIMLGCEGARIYYGRTFTKETFEKIMMIEKSFGLSIMEISHMMKTVLENNPI